jgi:hypothetical protein
MVGTFKIGEHLGVELFDPVLRLRLSRGLPLHVAWFIGRAV